MYVLYRAPTLQFSCILAASMLDKAIRDEGAIMGVSRGKSLVMTWGIAILLALVCACLGAGRASAAELEGAQLTAGQPATVSTAATNFAISGDAVKTKAGSVTLTKALDWQCGGMWLKKPVVVRSGMKISFKYRVSRWEDSSLGHADGIMLNLSKTSGLGSSGEGLGFVGYGAYGVELDSYQNNGDPAEPHIAIVKDDVSNHLATKVSSLAIAQKWTTATVTYKSKTLTVTVGGKQLLSRKNVKLPSKLYIGLTASTGSGHAKHEVKDLKVSGAATSLVKSKMKIKVSDVVYTGAKRTPAVAVTFNGKKLVKNTDFTVSYSKNVNVGTAKVTVKGKGKYAGTVKTTFKIKPKGTIRVLVYGAAKGEQPNSRPNVSMMQEAFAFLKIPGYKFSLLNIKVVHKKGFVASEFNSAVKKTFANSKASDLNFVYLNAHGKGYLHARVKDYATGQMYNQYRGHGVATGPRANDYYGWSQMLNYLGKNIKGQIVFMPEVCFSGGYVTAAKNCSAKNRLTVFAAASYSSPSNTMWDVKDVFNWVNYGGVGGIFTRALAKGIRTFAADGSGSYKKDNVVTVGELYAYICNDAYIKAKAQEPQLFAPNKSLVLRKK